MQRLERPAPGDEPGGEVVEQVGMGGGVAELAEVARGRDHPPAEVPAPDPVDDDPAGERGRLARRSPRRGRFRPLPIARTAGARRARDGREEPPGGDRAGVGDVPAEEDGQVSRGSRAIIHRPSTTGRRRRPRGRRRGRPVPWGLRTWGFPFKALSWRFEVGDRSGHTSTCPPSALAAVPFISLA